MNDISHTKIIPYQSDWPDKFQTEKEKLQDIFGDQALAIEHIGSTSIPGLSAKPIIDLAVMIEKHTDADKFVEPLANLGYNYEKQAELGERHFFRKGDPIEYQLSIAYADRGGFWPRQIMFRDYLRNYPEVRDEYADLKNKLLQQNPTGRDGYIDGKSEFVAEVLKLAGWVYGRKYVVKKY